MTAHGDEHLAPVIPLFGSSSRADAREEGPGPQHPAARAAAALEHAERTAALHALARAHAPASDDPVDEGQAEPAPEQVRERAEEALVRKLRAKALSVSEARAVLRENDLDRDAIEDVIDDFSSRGYIDDRTLASLLVTSGVERKGQGRVALARSLSQRGLSREIIDDALAELPDDDAERALEYARSKAPGMSRLEPDTALRRLLGQLARRGYGGSVAMNAARTALREAGGTRSGARSGVRFVDSD
ncbi:regulatory protein RecX [Microbacterium sp. H1-D42]|uniref:regulatory protein RecX n=1 Tax=Microbacterium sp. H1-D42 TaxID=2925844 RepID=UPI001F531A7A|nr:regulatory protein RecX [Microbacterium sp. H1-D42]UNK69515.1 RecX family transcriptional regulator [Microbacterium sp. H1-D42]